MLTPSIFGENLFDNFFDDFFGFPVWDDRAAQKAEKKLYGCHAPNMMKTRCTGEWRPLRNRH